MTLIPTTSSSRGRALPRASRDRQVRRHLHRGHQASSARQRRRDRRRADSRRRGGIRTSRERHRSLPRRRRPDPRPRSSPRPPSRRHHPSRRRRLRLRRPVIRHSRWPRRRSRRGGRSRPSPRTRLVSAGGMADRAAGAAARGGRARPSRRARATFRRRRSSRRHRRDMRRRHSRSRSGIRQPRPGSSRAVTFLRSSGRPAPTKVTAITAPASWTFRRAGCGPPGRSRPPPTPCRTWRGQAGRWRSARWPPG